MNYHFIAVTIVEQQLKNILNTELEEPLFKKFFEPIFPENKHEGEVIQLIDCSGELVYIKTYNGNIDSFIEWYEDRKETNVLMFRLLKIKPHECRPFNCLCWRQLQTNTMEKFFVKVNFSYSYIKQLTNISEEILEFANEHM